MAIDKFRPYIEGTKFTVITDHASLIWLNNIRDPSGRLGRWSLKLQQYNFELKHRKGKFHVVPDALSRSMAVDVLALGKDLWYVNLKSGLENTPEKYPLFKLITGKIFKVYQNKVVKLVVPLEEQIQVLEACHDSPMSAHLGVKKTIARIKEKYYWPKLTNTVKEYVRKCEICKASKQFPTCQFTYGEGKNSTGTMVCYCNRLFGALITRSKQGNAYIFVVLDIFTKFVLLFPLRNSETSNTIKILEQNVFLLFGSPKTLISDNGPQFISNRFQSFLQENGVRHYRNARYHPQNNPAERVNRVIIASIRAYLKDSHRDWDKELHKISCAIRTAKHESTGFTPYFLNFGREMYHYAYDIGELSKRIDDANFEESNIPGRVRKLEDFAELKSIVQKNLEKAHQKAAHYYNLRTRPRQFLAGDVVWKKNFQLSDASKNFSAKLAKRIKCKIKKPVGSNVYLLEDMDGKELGVFHSKDFSPD